MSDFLEIPGASGGRYRFRRAHLDALPATAGNVVIVTGRPPKLRVCGTAASLARASQGLRSALARLRGGRLFVRRNVVRAVREAEHADIVEHAGSVEILTDLG